MNNLEQVLKRYYKFILFAIFILAIILRWWYLPAKAVSFAFDQARDAFVVQEILGGHIKILGPSVNGIPGLYHGVLYYYVLALAYLVGRGSPIGAAYFMGFLNALTVFGVYLLTYLLTKKHTPALIASLIFAFSFEATQYAAWLSNPTMAIWFVPLIYIGLYLWLKGKSVIGPLVAGFGLGFSIQSNVALGYHLLPVIFWLWLFRKEVRRKDVMIFLGSLIFAVSSMILAEFKFGFRGISGIYYLLSSQDMAPQTLEFGNFLVIYLNQLGKSLAYTIFPLKVSFGGLVGVILLFSALLHWVKNRGSDLISWEPFLATYIFVYIFALPFGGSGIPHAMSGVTAGIAVFVGIFIWKFLSQYKYLFIGVIFLILLFNSIKILFENKKGQTNLVIQGESTLANQLKTIDYTYEKANGKGFSINTLTRPLYINTLWSYLYNWYGKQKYGYLPSWTGRDQVGQLGNNLARPAAGVIEHFYIIESTYGIPEMYVNLAQGEEDAKSTLIGQQSFGEITIQERKITNEK
ncbi:hypothetical protein MUP46_02910 [Patescibacteria group bacterium]|nr:hypothetical protein [Patescibacteria group bacterium]